MSGGVSKERGRVLVVDDEPVVHTTLQLALEDSELEIEGVGSAEEAMEKFSPGAYDALILDKNLPGLSGIQLLRHIRERDRQVGCMIISGSASLASAAVAIELGVDAYLEKPFDVDVVAREIQNVVERARKRRRQRATTKGELRMVIASPDAEQRTWIADHFAGTDVVEAATSAETLAQTEDFLPAVLIVDASIDGGALPLLRQLRRQLPQTVCMVACEPPTKTGMMELINAGAKVVLEKPLETAKFRQSVGRVLGELGYRDRI
jgi:DNA-binding response OmpR family regulator